MVKWEINWRRLVAALNKPMAICDGEVKNLRWLRVYEPVMV
jgi:hypothetical protein